MNTRFLKSASLHWMLSLFVLSQAIAHAEPTANPEPRFDIQIEGGQLSLEPLKGRVDSKKIWAQDYYVPATIDNLTKYLRAVDTNLNIVVSIEASAVKINNLKLHAADMEEVVEAAAIATDMTLHGGRSSGMNNWFFATQPQKKPTRTVDVFNVSGYIHSLGNSDEDAIHQKLDEIQELIGRTLKELHQDDPVHPPPPEFNFHPGTSLLVVVGTPETIEVTRKFIDALPGQQAAQLEQAQQLFDALDKRAAEKQK